MKSKVSTADKLIIKSHEALLLIVDVQAKLCPAMDQAWLQSVISQIGLMTLFAKLENIPIILSEQYPQGLGSTHETILKHLEGIHYQYHDKLSFGCGGDPKILKTLKTSKRKKIIIVGMETHICVYLTALDLVKKGFEVFVCHDGVIARQKSNHENGLSLIEKAGGIVINTETLAFQMMGCSGGQTFKAVSNYLKNRH